MTCPNVIIQGAKPAKTRHLLGLPSGQCHRSRAGLLRCFAIGTLRCAAAMHAKPRKACNATRPRIREAVQSAGRRGWLVDDGQSNLE